MKLLPKLKNHIKPKRFKEDLNSNFKTYQLIMLTYGQVIMKKKQLTHQIRLLQN